jgi:multiple sugar transport system permease protein
VVFTFLEVWNDYLGPLVYLRDPDTYTMALGLTFFQVQYGGLQHFLMATSVLMLIPPIVIYYFAQRHLIGGIASVGLKG